MTLDTEKKPWLLDGSWRSNTLLAIEAMLDNGPPHFSPIDQELMREKTWRLILERVSIWSIEQKRQK